ncbi:MAG: AraC family transcriptional regulator [Solirubrobacterales bacterium]|nr:AraC family transcriptional regulator [Solirubrobacterales bacterium]
MAYVEHVVASPLVCCTWEQWTGAPHAQRVVPDACVDLIWSGESLTIAGPDTRARLVELAPGARIVGVRLRPGVAGAVLGLPATELCDEAPDADDVVDRESVERLLGELHAGGDPHAILMRAIARRADRAPDALVAAAIAALNHPEARVAAVADDLGVSARQLQRRVAGAVGYGPKLLARVLRFRRLQALAAPRTGELVDLALDAGYADQAHMTAEVTRLTGLSPVRFLKDRTPTTA